MGMEGCPATLVARRCDLDNQDPHGEKEFFVKIGTTYNDVTNKTISVFHHKDKALIDEYELVQI